ncbi:MAG TPA: dipeptidase [Bacteroidota bacterium]|nr:dipeptidase [Bacteroidota bacterium]
MRVQRQAVDPRLQQRAEQLAHEILIIDTHIDVPYRLQEKMEDISVRTTSGDFDYPRARQGGLDAAFMSIYVPSSYEETGGGKDLAEQLIQMVEKFATDWPDKFALAYSTADIRRNHQRGVLSLPMGMENGTPLEGKLENLHYFYQRGIRYITLTHAKSNDICDSSFDPERRWNGLSPFGVEVVKEMNRLGMMIDVSHVSDSAFFQILRITKAPVIASHSSCRYFTPDWERNMSDEMIRALAKNGGVIQINFGSSFLKDESRRQSEAIRNHLKKYFEEHGMQPTDSAAQEYERQYRLEHPRIYADVKDVADHIDHVVQLVGVDYVGLGSDFDGVGDSLPTGLKDVSMYPNLIAELLERGYSEQDIRKICGENLMRVWSQVEQVAGQVP